MHMSQHFLGQNEFSLEDISTRVLKTYKLTKVLFTQENSSRDEFHPGMSFTRVNRGDWLGNTANFEGACYCYGFRVVTF